MKKLSSRTWIAILLVVVTAILYFQISPSIQPPSEPVGPPPETGHFYRIEKKGAGAIVDFIYSASKAHSAVDAGIAKAKWSVKDMTATKKEIPRQNVEGLISWHNRQLIVAVGSDTTIDSAKRIMSEAVKATGAIVIAAQAEQYKGSSAIRLDIGFQDILAGDAISVITDKLYLLPEKPGESAVKNKQDALGRGELAVVIDDFGYAEEPIGAFATINRPITFAVLPNRSYTSEAASKGISSGHQIIVHMPMEALSASAMVEPITVNVSMSESEIRDTVNQIIQSVPGAIGVNNHQGSKATSDRRVMKVVLSTIKINKMFFMDSRTSGQSVAYDVAKQIGLRTTENEVFLDNVNEVNAVKQQLRVAGKLALRNGKAVVIGHARMNTAIALKEMIPELEAEGVKFVFVSQMVK